MGHRASIHLNKKTVQPDTLFFVLGLFLFSFCRLRFYPKMKVLLIFGIDPFTFSSYVTANDLDFVCFYIRFHLVFPPFGKNTLGLITKSVVYWVWLLYTLAHSFVTGRLPLQQ